MFIKKGAMFGLDARIALAIFGALSVISGAALYSAIQESKYTKVLVELNEVEKAIEQYILDTGNDLPIYGGSGFTMDIEELIVDSGVQGWNGPYLSGQMLSGDATKLVINGSDTTYFKIKNATSSTWDAPEPASGTGDGTCGSPCFYWIEIQSGGAFSLNDIKSLEERIDGSANLSEGNARVYEAVGVMYIKAFNMLNN
jgi:type II secretory pathway pseudopilin PulG